MQYCITRYCRIVNRRIVVNGETVVQGGHENLPEWTEEVFTFLHIDYPKFYKMDLMSRLGFLAAEFVLAGFTGAGSDSMAIVLANSHASLDTDIKYQRASSAAPSPALFVYTLPNIVTGEIAIRHGFKGENAFFVSSRFEADTLHTYTEQIMTQPFTNTCLAGWVDVLDAHHDVLLYLVEKRSDAGSKPHTAEQIELLYRNNIWNS